MQQICDLKLINGRSRCQSCESVCLLAVPGDTLASLVLVIRERVVEGRRAILFAASVVVLYVVRSATSVRRLRQTTVG